MNPSDQKFIDAACVLIGVENVSELKKKIDKVYSDTGSVPKYIVLPQLEAFGLKIKFDEDTLKPCIQTKGHNRVNI